VTYFLVVWLEANSPWF